jgi:drug/metabolite transporter (DMT)-like permease
VGVLLALGAGFIWGTSSFFGGLLSRRMPAVRVVVFAQVGGLVAAAIVVAVRHDGDFTGLGLLYGLLAGAVNWVTLISLYAGMAIAMGVVAPLSALQPVVPLIFGLAKGDSLSLAQGIGIAVALVGVVLVGVDDPHKVRSARLAVGAGLGLLAAVAGGTAFIFLKYSTLHSNSYWAVFDLRVAMLTGAFTFCLARRIRPTAPAKWTAAGAALGIVDTGAVILFAIASTKGLIGVISILASLYPVVTLLLARIVLGDRVTPLKLVGAAAALAGAALVSV